MHIENDNEMFVS